MPKENCSDHTVDKIEDTIGKLICTLVFITTNRVLEAVYGTFMCEVNGVVESGTSFLLNEALMLPGFAVKSDVYFMSVQKSVFFQVQSVIVLII